MGLQLRIINDFEYLRALRKKKIWLWQLTTIVEGLMADIEQIRADITALQNAQSAAVTELGILSEQVHALLQAGADNITQADLESLHENIQSVTSALVAGTQSAAATAGQPVVTPLEQQSDETDAV